MAILRGRPIGHRDTRTQMVINMLEEHNYDPIAAMITLSQKTDDEMIQFGCHKEIARYCYPQLKQVYVDAQQNAEIVVNIKSFTIPPETPLFEGIKGVIESGEILNLLPTISYETIEKEIFEDDQWSYGR